MSDGDSTTPIEFRNVPGFPGYRVGDNGAVQSCWKGKNVGSGKNYKRVRLMTEEWWNLKAASRRSRYPLVQLYQDGRLHTRPIHRLVLEAFVGPRKPDEQCRHLDGNPWNNHLSNICWGTALENKRDQIRHGTNVRGSRHPLAKVSESDIPKIRSLFFQCVPQRVIATAFGLDQKTVWLIVHEKAWSHV